MTKSFKQSVFQFLIVLIIVIVVVLGMVFSYILYDNKVSTLKHNQTQVLKQVEFESDKLLNEITKIADYLYVHYEPKKNILKGIVQTNENVSSILILDNQGIVQDFSAMSNRNIYEGFDFSNKTYFKKITPKDTQYWSNIFLSNFNESPSITYSFKLKDKIGVIFIELSELSQFVERFKNTNGSHMIRMFDKNGIMILNPDKPELIFQRFNAMGSSVFQELILKLKPYELSKFSTVITKSKNYGMYTQIERTGWKIVIRQSYTLLMQSIFEVLVVMCASISLFILIAIYFSLNLTKKIFKGFDDLEKTALTIAQGDYDIKLKKGYYSEFNTLIKSFENMKEELDKREGSLEESVQSFKSLVDSTMEAIILHENGECLEVNDVAVRMFGFNSKSQMIGKGFIQYFSAKSQRLIHKNLHLDTDPYELEVKTQQGKTITTLGRGRFFYMNGKKIKMSVLIDITELKHKDRLLSQQSKMAAMGEMLENIAHQWRQPLSRISTSASGLQVQNEFELLSKEEAFEGLEEIIKTTQYLSDTVNDFRNFFKHDKNEEVFNIKEIIEHTFKLLKGSFKNEEIEVSMSIDETLFLKGYANELTQALINILNNAKDALILNDIEYKYIDINVCMFHEKIRITIQDNAGGIALENLPKLFEPYFTTKHKTQGTGIGLYMTHQIVVDHMKGMIDALNTPMLRDGQVYSGCSFILEFEPYAINAEDLYTYNI